MGYIYKNAAQNTRVPDRFQYFEEDCGCKYCRCRRGKKNGCPRAVCRCEDIRADADAHGRIKRKHGWNRQWRE